MTEREKVLKDYLTNSEEALSSLQRLGFLFLDSSFIWQILIYELEHYDIPSEVLFHHLTTDEIVTCVKDYFSKYGLPIKNITIDNSVIPNELNTDFSKAKVKFKGEIWTIHKNDKDTFPSQPHAHNYDRQYKLHLGNGKLFRSKNYIGNISNKDLLNLRQIIAAKVTPIKLPIYENN